MGTDWRRSQQSYDHEHKWELILLLALWLLDSATANIALGVIAMIS